MFDTSNPFPWVRPFLFPNYYRLPDRRSQKTFDTFHFFPLLPIELRFYIWSLYSIHYRPRVVNISSRRCHHRGCNSWHLCTKPLAQLHVNREARSEALRVYKRFPHIDPTVDSAPHSYIYLDLEHDIVRMNEIELKKVPVAEQKQLRRVILDVYCDGYLPDFPDEILPKMEQLNILELVISLSPENEKTGKAADIAEFFESRFDIIASNNPEWKMPPVKLTWGTRVDLGYLEMLHKYEVTWIQYIHVSEVADHKFSGDYEGIRPEMLWDKNLL
ncbi:hypothetical protein BO94DRAFT_614440 [Aspergillus sclerotioniger CBS 115572]|uniref:2EXR domain-containing protein n=1 Tax=Aspergillus sclerotioniger CBS 115572 TaxID=1450535 RepID=A0A317X435_9EURO|nr:hypothetical protein BO94DRAFT_614440 [Aspergillus sclerotioniger CBS 115572]PWY93394.1 hypothetical protein BO94DRAFT_614440 [Aspergillus sclerotioniger CBS 115572]